MRQIFCFLIVQMVSTKIPPTGSFTPETKSLLCGSGFQTEHPTDKRKKFVQILVKEIYVFSVFIFIQRHPSSIYDFVALSCRTRYGFLPFFLLFDSLLNFIVCHIRNEKALIFLIFKSDGIFGMLCEMSPELDHRAGFISFLEH